MRFDVLTTSTLAGALVLVHVTLARARIPIHATLAGALFPYMLRLQEHMFPYMLRARVKKLLDGDEEQETLLQFIDSAMKRPDSKQVLEVRPP